MEIELVIFDMAGTTVQDGDAVHRSLCEALANAGRLVSRDEANEVMGIPKPIAIRRLLERGQKAISVREERITAIHTDFLARMLEFYRTDPGVQEVRGASALFRKLRAVGIKVGLNTGFSRPIADTIIERFGWAEGCLLDVTVTSDEVERGRPYPDMVYRAMDRTGVSDVRCVVKVGDTPSDLQEGTAAGCGMVVGVTQGSHTRAQLTPYPHTHLIETIADLPSLLELRNRVFAL